VILWQIFGGDVRLVAAETARWPVFVQVDHGTHQAVAAVFDEPQGQCPTEYCRPNSPNPQAIGRCVDFTEIIHDTQVALFAWSESGPRPSATSRPKGPAHVGEHRLADWCGREYFLGVRPDRPDSSYSTLRDRGRLAEAGRSLGRQTVGA